MQQRQAVSLSPVRDRFLGFLPFPDFVRMRADNEKRVNMFLDNLLNRVEPLEHVVKNDVRVFLAGIKNDIGKNRISSELMIEVSISFTSPDTRAMISPLRSSEKKPSGSSVIF